MPKLPRLTAEQLQALLLQAGFGLLRTKGSHRIYARNAIRVVIPFHGSAALHPKIVKQALSAIEEAELQK